MCSESARSSMDRASGFEPEGWEFESLRARIFGSPGAFTAPERPENALYSSQSDECAPQTRILLYRQSRCAKCAVLNPEGGEHSADFQQQSGHYLNEYQAPRPAPCFSKYPFFTRFFM